MEVVLAGFGETLASILPILYTLAAAAGLDFLTGVYAAWKSGTLEPEFLPTFFTSNVLKKIVPIVLVLVAGIALAGSSAAAAAPIVALAGAAAAAYLASAVASITSNLQEGSAGTKGAPTSVTLPEA